MKAVSVQSELALHGGTPIRTRPFAAWPQFSADEVAAAARVLQSGQVNYWTGEEGRQFEKEFAAFVGCRHAVAVANGTVALELALHALGIGAGDEVIVTSRTFVATASCVLMRRATPVFADVDVNSGNLTAETVRPLLTARTKAVIAVHLGGWPCDMQPLLKLARQHGLYVIEDCAQSMGARYQGKLTGSLGDVAAFSFCQDKIMSTGGEGGMLTTNSEGVWERAWSFKDHGKNREAAHRPAAATSFRWLHDSAGTNWRLTEMQSAIGRVILRNVPDRVAKRRANALLLDRCLAGLPALRSVSAPHDVSHAYYRYYAFVEPERLLSGWNRDRIVAAINAEGIPCGVGSCSEIYLEKAFSTSLRPVQRHPVASRLAETSLMFHVHNLLSEEDMLDTASAVEKVMWAASL